MALALILIAVDTILILRGKSKKSHLLAPVFLFLLVTALYHGNAVMRWVVLSFFLIEIVGMVVGLALSLPKTTFDNLCLIVNAPRTLMINVYAFLFLSSIPIYTDR